MQKVVAHRGGEPAVGVEHLVAPVAPDDVLTIRELHDLLVDEIVPHSQNVALVFAPRRDGAEDDLGLRLLLLYAFQNFLDANYDVSGRLVIAVLAGVVCADHKDYGLGLVPVEFAVLDAVENVLGLVAAVAEVQRIVGIAVEMLVPDAETYGFVVVRDGVADEDHFDLIAALLDVLKFGSVADHPPVIGVIALGDRRAGGRFRRLQ